ncbi:MAG: hypothetical protein ACJ8AD_08705 [Gemmatimonadaceae bacterium]
MMELMTETEQATTSDDAERGAAMDAARPAAPWQLRRGATIT